MPIEGLEHVNAFYGFIGLGAIVALKYFYPSFKKFMLRRFVKKGVIKPTVHEQLTQNPIH
jgi:hypothetical protein